MQPSNSATKKLLKNYWDIVTARCRLRRGFIRFPERWWDSASRSFWPILESCKNESTMLKALNTWSQMPRNWATQTRHYAKVMLGTTPTKEFGKHKIILGVPWNTSSDRLLFDVSMELAHLAKKFQPESCQCNWQILPPFWSLTPIITSVSIESRKLKKNQTKVIHT